MSEGKNIRRVVVTLIILAVISAILIFAPNYIKDEIKDRTNLVINNENITSSLYNDLYIDEQDVVYLSREDIKNFFDENIYYDENYKVIITGSKNKIATLQLDKNEIIVNGNLGLIKNHIIIKDDTYYIPFSELDNVYNVKTEYIKNTNTVVIESLDREQRTSVTINTTSLRYKPTFFSKNLGRLKTNEELIIVSEKDNWYKVRTNNGLIGYVEKQNVYEPTITRPKTENIKDKPEKVSLIWDYFSEYGTAPDRSGTKINGVNVVSPTFFTLVSEGKGEINVNVGEEGTNYINWAHSNGYEVWPSISNNSYIKTTSEILNDYTLRTSFINRIVNLVKQYKLDGINIDFEYMYMSDKDMFSRLIIELAPRLNEIGAVLSVDVTAPDGAEDWSMCYDRHKIGKVADYIVFMAYDQYGLSSNEPGTTAGYDWIEVNLKKFVGTQEEIDSSKVILALPFYTRLWTEENGKVDSYAIGMKNVDKIIPNDAIKTWDDDLKQHYTEYTNGSVKYKMWIEDVRSFNEKIYLVEKYNLAGAGYWQKDMEMPEIWDLISEKLGIN